MKLLDKREIDRAKAAERKLDIDQGAKLASKVDKLRELASKEEGSLNRYVAAVREAALAQVAEYVKQRDQALSDAITAQQQRDALLKPINYRAEEFKSREAALEAAREALKQDKQMLAGRSALMDKRENEARVAKEINDEEAAALHKISIETLRLQKESRADRSTSANLLADTETKAGQILADAGKKSMDLKARELSHARDREKLANDVKALNARERAIIDREETLARELRRQVIKATA